MCQNTLRKYKLSSANLATMGYRKAMGNEDNSKLVLKVDIIKMTATAINYWL